MDDLTAFIGARLDDEEATAKDAEAELAALPGDFPRETHIVYRLQHAGFGLPYQGFALVHDPARVLREIEAKRAIVADHAPSEVAPDACRRCKGGMAFPCRTVRAIAAIWNDHPDYQPEWASAS